MRNATKMFGIARTRRRQSGFFERHIQDYQIHYREDVLILTYMKEYPMPIFAVDKERTLRRLCSAFGP